MTVQEWLGEDNKLGIDIWEKKYRYNNESFDEWLDRVSGGNNDVKQLIIEKKFLFGGRILSNRGLEKDGRKASLSNCFSFDTEIVTKEGIKKIGSLEEQKIQVLSFGKWRDATVKNFGKQKLIALHIRKGRAQKKLFVTENHIWYVRNKKNKYITKTTSELCENDKIPIDVMKCYRTYKPSPFGVAHGAFYGDGDHTGKNRRMNFCGDKKELLPYFTPDTVGNSNDTLTVCGIPKIFWEKPSLDETPSYLYGWLAGYFATDGSIDERGSCILTSSNKEDLEFVQDVLAVLGIPCEEIRVQNRLSNLTNKFSDIYILTLNKKYLNESFFIIQEDKERFINNPPKKPASWKVDYIDYNDSKIENVYCVIEEEKHSFTLKGNILTHNCYVMTPPEDSIESIFDCAKKLARTYSYGGGCGIDISKLAPRGAKVNNTAKETSGSVSFMDLYSLVTELIGQNGRRGALMLSIDCNHPDLEEFIDVKTDLNRVTKANISVKITNKFMEAVKNKEHFELEFTRKETGEIIKKTVDAYAIFEKLCKNNWDYAEPGMLFWDRIENWNLLSEDSEFKYAGVNPCAEEPLSAGGSCLLGSINLSEFVDCNNKFNFVSFMNAVETAIIALNEVLDEGLPLHPLREQQETVKDWRQIGLGIMGLADMLIKMKIRYGSPESIEICNKIGYTMANTAISASAELACGKGAYPKYKLCVTKSKFFLKNTSENTKDKVRICGLRNSQLLTTAPTGTLSSMLGISGGIEPIYANYYERKTESLHGHDEYYKVYTPIVKEYMKSHNLKDESELPDYFVTAQTLKYRERIDMQAVWQKHIDASISSTINVPNDFTVEQVEDLYMTAWEKGLKGVTIYRDGCKRSGILSTSDNETVVSCENMTNEIRNIPRGIIIKADDNCVGKKRSLITGCGTLHCEAFFDPDTGNLLETYLSKGSSGGCNQFMIGLSRLISLAARGGVDIYSIVDQLKSSGTCPSYAVRRATQHDTSLGSSCPVAVGNALMDMYDEIQEELGLNNEEYEKKENNLKKELDKKVDLSTERNVEYCPECGSASLAPQEGCFTCQSCGWTKCAS